MTVPLQDARNSLLERATAYVRSRLHGPQAERAGNFVRSYWERVPAEDLLGRDPVDLAGAALAHLHLAEHRPPGSSRVRVYTPNFDDHGWASTHSVVEGVAFIHVEIDRQPAGERLETLRADLLAVLDDVRAAVDDWAAMRAQA